MITFVIDLFRLLHWSFFQPSRLANHVHSLHPNLTVYRGLSQYLWLARKHPPIRYFILLNLTWWVIMGFTAGFLLIATQPEPNTAITIAQDLRYALAITLMISVAVNTMLGLTFVVPFITTMVVAYPLVIAMLSLRQYLPTLYISPLSLCWAMSGGLSFDGYCYSYMPDIAIYDGTYVPRDYNIALQNTVIGLTTVIAFGMLGAIVDAMWGAGRQRLTKNYWGRSLLGVIMGMISVFIIYIIFVAGGKVRTAGRGGLIRDNFGRIKWVLLDGFLLGSVICITVYNYYPHTHGNPFRFTHIVFATVNILLLMLASGVAIRIGNGLSLIGLLFTHLFFLLFFYYIDILSISLILLIIGLYVYVRIPIYLLELPWQAWVYWQAKQQRERALIWLKRSPVYYDDLIFYPLFGLDRLLFLVMKQNREAGLHEADFLAQSFRQSWAAEWARLYLTVDILSHYQTRQEITQAAQELSWLTNNPPAPFGLHVAEIAQTLSAISHNLSQDNSTESLNQLENLQQGVTHLGYQTKGHWLPVLICWQNLLESSSQQKAALA